MVTRTTIVRLLAVFAMLHPVLALGQVEELKLPETLSAPYALEVDERGHVWFTEKVGKHLVTLDPAGTEFSIHPLPDSWGNVGPSQLTVAESGDIWFTIRRWATDDTQTNVLGKFIPATGTFVRFVLSLDVEPQEIVTDGTGIMWLLAANSNQLYRVDPADARVTSYEIPTPNSNAQGLAIGIKGDIWFSEASANKVARFSSTGGFFQEYDIPTAFSNPGDITVAPNGNVWFVQRASNRLGVLYPDLNRFDEALVPTISATPNAIEVDADGTVWFLEYRGNKIGAFDPVMGTFREFDIPSYASLPGDLALSPDGETLWFTESNTETSRLGKLPISSLTPVDAPDAVAEGGTQAIGEYLSAGTPLVVGLGLALVLLGAGVWVTRRSLT